MTTNDRYARQRLIEWWNQDRLQSARVLVAGVGALGNELLKNLALLGVGELLLIDFDRIERSNLSRTVLFTENDIGQFKVEAAARFLRQINPNINIQIINGDLFYDVGLGHYRHSNLAIGCLDNLAARSQVGLSCSLAGIPYLDGGMWSLGGEARWFLSGNGPCFDCTLSAGDQARADERRSCSGFRDPAWDENDRVPTVATTAAIIGGLLAQETAKFICGFPITAGRAIVFNGQMLTMHRSELPRNPNCPAIHTPYPNVIELPRCTTDVTARQLLKLAHQRPEITGTGGELSLALGRDFLPAFQCVNPNCGQRQTVNRLWGQVLEAEQICPNCGAARQAEVISDVTLDNPLADRSLADLGVPPGDVVTVGNVSVNLFLELTGDIQPLSEIPVTFAGENTD